MLFLNHILRVDIWEYFIDLTHAGTTLLVSSHVMDESDHCGDPLLMRDDHLIARTSPDRLREDAGCTSLKEAFLSISKHSTAPQIG